MKLVGIRDAQATFPALVAEAQKERVIVTRHGRPVAILTGIDGMDLENVILVSDPSFWRMIEERRAEKGPSVSHETLERETEAELAKRRPRRRRRTSRRR